MARPTKYTVKIGDQICANITIGKSLKKIADENDFCIVSIFNWLRTNEEFLNNYTRAKEEQAELFAEEIIEIADDGRNDTYSEEEDGFLKTNHDVIARSRLRVDARKWVASKLKPKKYGDLAKVNLEASVTLKDVDVPIRQTQEEWEANAT